MTNKHLRKNIISKAMCPKEELLKIVLNKVTGETVIDWKQNMTGRSAYLTNNLASLIKVKEKNLLSRSFKRSVSNETYDLLINDYRLNTLKGKN